MGIINRPQKTGGNRTYVEEVDAGFLDIIDFEVDEDFRVIYDEFNGHITNDNIDPNAGIVYSKLDLFHSITGSDLDPTTTLPPGLIPPGAIGPTELAVDATTHWHGQNGSTVTLPHSLLDTTEVQVSALLWTPASRNGLVWVFGMFSGFLGAPGAEVSLWARLRRDNLTGTQLAISTALAQGTGTTDAFPFQLSCMTLVRVGTGYQGPLILTAQLSAAAGAFVGPAAKIQDVQLIAFELS